MELSRQKSCWQTPFVVMMAIMVSYWTRLYCGVGKCEQLTNGCLFHVVMKPSQNLYFCPPNFKDEMAPRVYLLTEEHQ